MEKNDYMIINDLIYQLYTEKSFCRLKLTLLRRLKLLIPYSYASILMAQENKGRITLSDPVCMPDEFQKVENEYLSMASDDQLDWILYSSETVCLRESDFLKDDSRLNSSIYRKCYQDYHIYDTLQMSIVNSGRLYAVLTLYRTKEENLFSNDEVMYLHSLSKHLNYVFSSHLQTNSPFADPLVHTVKLRTMTDHFHLTRRESEILGFITEYLDNEEILERIPISEHTLQKHMQNIYRKCQVGTKLELLRLCAS